MQSTVPSIITSPTTESPMILVNSLLDLENDENNNLIQILGVIRPSNSSQTSITSLVRGLFTKNKQLLKILEEFSKQFNDCNNVNDEKQVFKHFINDFILWTNEGVMILFNKFKACLQNSDWADQNQNDTTYYSKPIMHLSHYISFVDASVKIIRNPYIIDQLKSFQQGCQECLEEYIDFMENSKLTDINFDQVQLFGATNSIRNYYDNVCSYFKVTQIVERSRNARLTLDNAKNKNKVELLLVNLNGLASQEYNALALLSIPSDNSHRSLMFPPFRVNELSLTYRKSRCQLVLKSIRFVGDTQPGVTDNIVINCPNEDFLAEWTRKLSVIFPLEKPNSPISPNFLIKLNDSPKIKMSGLGIDLLSDSSDSQVSEVEGNNRPNTADSSPAPQPFKELISSPTLNISPATSKPSSKLQGPAISIPKTFRSDSCTSESSSIAGFHQPRIPPFVKNSASAEPSPVSSVNTYDSNDSINSSAIPSASLTERPVSQAHEYILQNNLQVQNIRSGIPVTKQQPQDRPVSSSAEIEDGEVDDKENAPAVDQVSNQKGLFKHANGSGIDISNFGKSHNPSFSVHKGLNEMVHNERPKSKILGLFKKSKSSKSSNSTTPQLKPVPKIHSNNPKNLKINTQMPIESDSDTIPLSATSIRSGVSTVSQNASTISLTQHKNNSGTAFALPSSTSQKFFQKYVSSSDSEESDIVVPKELKDVINDDETIDFYISPSTPRAMKVSKWKAKYGKWEMLTINENVFVKIVVNYEMKASWLILFKEEYDQQYDEVVDKPIMLLDMNHSTEITQSSALDVQISSKDSITSEDMLIMVRCYSNNLAQSILSNVKNIKGALAPRSLKSKSSIPSSIGESRQTIASSVMEGNRHAASGITSKSSTVTSFGSSSIQSMDKVGRSDEIKKISRDFSLVSISSGDINNATILNNPENTKLLLLSNMKIRLQKQLDGLDQINNPSSWSILSMYSLSVFIISDSFTEKTYFNVSLEKTDSSGEGETNLNWLICEDDIRDRIQRIGKAGLLVKAANDDIFMIECRGKKEFKELYEVF